MRLCLARLTLLDCSDGCLYPPEKVLAWVFFLPSLREETTGLAVVCPGLDKEVGYMH